MGREPHVTGPTSTLRGGLGSAPLHRRIVKGNQMHRRLAALTALAVGLVLPGSALASSSGVVVSQVYGAGGNAGATYAQDYVELFNAGSSSVEVGGWSVQYASASGTGNFQVVAPLSG